MSDIIDVHDEDYDKFEDRTINTEMRSSYLEYAMSVIVGRALPDARDGLKPVHRRVLYAMHTDGNAYNKDHVKSAAIVGETMKHYHPHGDSSIYDTLVRMAQPWQLRAPLVDGQGNFGSTDGDGAAASRYTEARMTHIASIMLRDIDQSTVDWQDNYSNTKKEPSVLPARFPNLLVNGSSGIAVGMATNIPPHNLEEVSAAVMALIDDPEIDVAGLMQYIPAPDFPTGGLIVGRAGIRQGYETGRGRVIIRGVSHVEQRGGGRECIVVTEMPYGVQKGDGKGDGSGLIKKIVELVNEKKITEIVDVRDESSKDIRLVIDLRAGSIPQVVLNKLYKHTSLQTSFGMNMVALHHGQPQTMNLKQLLQAYVEHQVDVVTRRTRFQLDKARVRAHILEGLLIALSHLDRVIEIIRGSATREVARETLMEELGLSEPQTNAILDMRLGQLTSTDVGSVQDEHNNLTEKIASLRALLGDETAILGVVKDELGDIVEAHKTERRSVIIPGEDDFDVEDLIPETLSVVLLTEAGYLKRVSLDEFRAQSRGGVGAKGVNLQDDDDRLKIARIVSTHEWVLAFTNRGRLWRLRGWQVPEGGKGSRGRALANLLPLEENERIVALCNTRDFDESALVFATKNGIVKRTTLKEYDSSYRTVALRAIGLDDDDELIAVRTAEDDQSAIVLSKRGRAQRFAIGEVRKTGRTSRGVRAMKLTGDEIVSLSIHDEDGHLLLITEDGYGKRVPMTQFRIRHRGGMGVRAIPEGSRGDVIGGVAVEVDDELLVITNKGMVQRLLTADISSYSRGSKGVRVMKLGKDDSVVLMCLIKASELEAARQLSESAEAQAAEGNTLSAEAVEELIEQSAAAIAEGATVEDDMPVVDGAIDSDEDDIAEDTIEDDIDDADEDE